MLDLIEFNITMKTYEESENNDGNICIDEIIADFESPINSYQFIDMSLYDYGWSRDTSVSYEGIFVFKSDDISDWEKAGFDIKLD